MKKSFSLAEHTRIPPYIEELRLALILRDRTGTEFGNCKITFDPIEFTPSALTETS